MCSTLGFICCRVNCRNLGGFGFTQLSFNHKIRSMLIMLTQKLDPILKLISHLYAKGYTGTLRVSGSCCSKLVGSRLSKLNFNCFFSLSIGIKMRILFIQDLRFKGFRSLKFINDLFGFNVGSHE